jgi:hypothetical protein
MPIYLFQNPETNEVIEVQQRISDAHEHVDDNGLKWLRIFTVPNTSIPSMTRIDAGSHEDFMRKTQNTGGTYGDLFDLSKELSDKRKSQSANGSDPVEKKFFKDYSKERNGLKHQNDKPSSTEGTIEV